MKSAWLQSLFGLSHMVQIDDMQILLDSKLVDIEATEGGGW